MRHTRQGPGADELIQLLAAVAKLTSNLPGVLPEARTTREPLASVGERGHRYREGVESLPFERAEQPSLRHRGIRPCLLDLAHSLAEAAGLGDGFDPVLGRLPGNCRSDELMEQLAVRQTCVVVREARILEPFRVPDRAA